VLSQSTGKTLPLPLPLPLLLPLHLSIATLLFYALSPRSQKPETT